MKRHVHPVISAIFILSLFFVGCNKADAQTGSGHSGTAERRSDIKVTFIELGSVNCVPCKMMQPVMRQLEENFPNHVEVLFYDVWTKEQAQYAKDYGIRVIPTQVFLDADGKEYYRHEGFFPYDDIVEILKLKDVTD